MDLRTMLLYAAERAPERLALVEGSTRLTYAAWTERVHRVGNAVRARGIVPGDRVGIVMRNSADHATAFFALQSIGAVAVPFNFRFKAPDIAYVLEDSGAKAVFLDDPDLQQRLASAAPADVLQIVAVEDRVAGAERFADLVEEGDGAVPDVVVAPDDLSAILYTSGTTGRPKGVPVTHRSSHARMLSYLVSTGPFFGPRLCALGAAPLYHTVGLHWVLCLTVFLNGTYVPVREVTASVVLDLVERERVTFLFGSPTFFHLTLAGEEADAADLSSVTDVAFGSAPMPPALLARIGERLPAATINEVYGTTEISVPFTTRDAPRSPTGALRMTADFRVRVVKPGGSPDEMVPANEVGELIVDASNDGAFAGYWRRPEQTAERLRDGWYYTGDAFYHDGEGNYFITGRLDDMFISGGENIQPVEIETVLSGHPRIADVAVIGAPDERWGEAVTALVVRRDGSLTEAEVDRFCRESDLADFKRPRRIVFVDEIPRNPSGKIVRGALRESYVGSVS